MINKNCEAGIIFQIIQNEVIHLNLVWKSYEQIFRQDYEDVFKSTSSLFFYNLKNIFKDNMVLIVSRLFDEADKFWKKELVNRNLSFYQLLNHLEKENISKSEVSYLINDVNEIREFIKPTILHYRNKSLSHNDLHTILERNNQRILFPMFSLSDMEETIKRINYLTNHISEYFYLESKISDQEGNKYIQDYKIDFEKVNAEANIIMSTLRKAI